MISPEELSKLETIAKAATPWSSDDHEDASKAWKDNSVNNAAHCRAFNPATALRLIEEIRRLTEERDLAVAHDSQPYPTAEAYELVCKAIDKWRASYDRKIQQTIRFCNKLAAKDELLKIARDALVFYAKRGQRARQALAALDAKEQVI